MSRNGLGVLLVILMLLSVPSRGFGQTDRRRLSGRVLDPSGAAIPAADVSLQLKSTGLVQIAKTDAAGAFRFEALESGDYVVNVLNQGFAPFIQSVTVSAGQNPELEIRLQLATLAQEVAITASEIVGSPENLRHIPGSVEMIDSVALVQGQVFTTDEALRKVAGVHTRSEEGFGLRPNIGIRGLNPTRSAKVLLLEDGIPISFAPYGDNATYYHPPIDRFERIEVVKGAGQILYGPMTIGGVINYITPRIPERRSGSLTALGGSRSYLNGHLQYGGIWRNTGYFVDLMRKQGTGARENVRSGLNDLNFKSFTNLTPRQALAFKVNYYDENSNVTYSGLTEEEFRISPRGNPFRNDFFFGRRLGTSATYTNAFTNNLALTANFYGSHFNRDWWRQSSNSGQRPNDRSDPACGSMANLHTTCGNEGRLRGYSLWGMEPRFRSRQHFWGMLNEADFGFRAHLEDQDRQQKNGDRPTSREGRLVENNKRKNQAYSAFFQNRLVFGGLTLTPGLRLERVRYKRINRLVNASGTTNVIQWIPGFGVSYSPADAFTIFSGLHRGFAPPRTEDIINNAGGSVDLDPELSWNYEIGLRARFGGRGTLEATYFRMDYANQIIPASVAGGIGATLTSAGQTLHQGVELAGRWHLAGIGGSRHSFSLGAAYTGLPTANFVGTRFSSIPGFQQVSVSGNRLPYAPRYLLNASLGYSHASALNAFLEGVFSGQQFGDDLNTVAATADGQRGIIPGNTVWNATLSYPMESMRTTVFLTVKNLFDRTFIVDRARGILPGSPRLVQAGLRFTF